MRSLARPFLGFTLTAALLVGGCRRAAPPQIPAVLSLAEILKRPPDILRQGLRGWTVDDIGYHGALYVEVTDEVPLQYSPGFSTLLLVLAGKMDIRVNEERWSAAPGAAVFVPPNSTYRIRKFGPDRLVLAWIHRPTKKLFFGGLQAPLTDVR